MLLPLIPHPRTPCPWITRFEAEVSDNGPDFIMVDYRAHGDEAHRIVFPDMDVEVPERRDGLWQTTCFEAFLGIPGVAYVEFNFAPAGDWAAYAFTGYRAGMHLPEVRHERHFFMSDGSIIELIANLDRQAVPGIDEAELWLGLSAVLEDDEGRLSYWALAHADGPPNFHHRDGFAVRLMDAMST